MRDLSLAEEIWYEIFEAIHNTNHRQDGDDVYLRPAIFEILKEHPEAEEDIPNYLGKHNLAFDGVEIGSIRIKGVLFMCYPNAVRDYEFYVYGNADNAQDIVIIDKRGDLKCLPI